MDTEQSQRELLNITCLNGHSIVSMLRVNFMTSSVFVIYEMIITRSSYRWWEGSLPGKTGTWA